MTKAAASGLATSDPVAPHHNHNSSKGYLYHDFIVPKVQKSRLKIHNSIRTFFRNTKMSTANISQTNRDYWEFAFFPCLQFLRHR